MKRRARGEKIARFRGRVVKEICEPLRRQAFRWASDTLETLRSIEPKLPEGLNDRAADNWLPLFAIAEHCGGEWPKQACEAAKELSADSDEAEGSALIDLLQELKTLFEKTDRVTSANLADHLGGQSERRWAEWYHGKPITPRQIARLLSPLKITPSSIRVGDETPRGYLSEWFDDAFMRYLPDSIRNNATNEKNQSVSVEIDPQQSCLVADEKSDLSAEKLENVADVADRNTGLWERIV